MKISTAKLNIEYAFVQALCWMGYCVAVGFAAVFLQGRGYSNTGLGLILAIGSLCGFLLANSLAQAIDRGGRLNVFNCLWLLLFAQTALVVTVRLLGGAGLAVSVLYCVYVSCVIASTPLYTELSFVMDGWTGRINFGMTRSAGSLGYALIAIVSGQIVKLLGSEALPLLSLIMLAAQAALLLIINVQSRRESSGQALPSIPRDGESKDTLSFLRDNSGFALLLLGLSLLFFTHNLTGNFLINLVRKLGGDEGTLGSINGIAAIAEIPAMIAYSRVTRRIRCRTVLGFSLMMFTVKAVAVALAPSVGWLFFAQCLQCIGYAPMTPALVQYAGQTVPIKDSAKAQALAGSVSSLGAAVAGLLGGRMYDCFSLKTTLLVGVAVSAAGSAICLASLLNKNRAKAI